MKLPPEVIDIVLAFCDRPTRYSVLQTCSPYHDVAIPHVYQHIILSSARQVRAFECLVRLAKCTARIAVRFHHTRSFFYRLGTGRSASSIDHARMAYLSLAYMDATTGDKRDTQASLLFPHLQVAKFEPLPALETPMSPYAPGRPTIFSTVSEVHLLHSPYSHYDKAPSFHALGLLTVDSLHMHHLVGAEVQEEADIDRYLGRQESLKHIHLHLRSHFAWAIGHTVDLSESDTREADWYVMEYSTAVAYTVFKLAYFRRRFTRDAPCNFPVLEDISIDIGHTNGHIAHEVLQHSMEKIFFFKRQYIDGLGGNPVPKIAILGSAGSRWLLDGLPTPPHQRSGYTDAWQHENPGSA